MQCFGKNQVFIFIYRYFLDNVLCVHFFAEKDSMKILAIETCFGKCSVCFGNGSDLIQKVEERKNTHRESLPRMTHEILAQSGARVQDVDAIAVNHGPGTFTGIRIGIAFAQGLALPFQIPVYGISTTEALITEVNAEIRGVAVRAIGDFCYYQQFFGNGECISGPEYIAISEIPQTPKLIAVGIGDISTATMLESTPNAEELIKRFLFVKPQIYSKPLYLRETGIQVPEWKKRIK